jgi:DNA topoisomerase-1
VSELIPHRAEIDPKYQFLCDAPVQDDQGNSTIVRFSRKNKEQYVMSEQDGKATGWTAHFQEGKWVISKPEAKSTAKKKTVKKKAAKKKSTKKATKKAS